MPAVTALVHQQTLSVHFLSSLNVGEISALRADCIASGEVVALAGLLDDTSTLGILYTGSLGSSHSGVLLAAEAAHRVIRLLGEVILVILLRFVSLDPASHALLGGGAAASVEPVVPSSLPRHSLTCGTGDTRTHGFGGLLILLRGSVSAEF